MKLKRILSAALAAVVMVNAVTAPVESYAKSPNVEPNVSEATVDYTDYKDKLSSDFYGTLLKMTVVDKESMLNSLTGDELYEVYLLAKYELAHEIIDLKNSKKDFKMEDFFFVTSYFRETFQIAQLSKENAPQNKGAVEKTVAEKLSKKYGKSCNSASSYQAYLQSLTNLNVSELLKQIDTIAFTDTDNEAGMITKFEDYVYATFGFDEWVVGIYENTPTEFKEVSGEPSTEENAEPEKEEGEQAEEKPANLIKQPRALTHKVLDSNKPSFPGENQFSPQFIPGKTHVALSGAPSGAYWDWTGSTIELVTARNVSYQLKSNEKGKYWAKYSNVGIYKGRQVDLKITLTDYSWNSNDSDTKPKRVAFGQQNVGFGYASYNTNMNPKRWARFRMDYTYTDGSKVTGLKGHMAIDDMDYFASSEEIQLLTGNGCESTVYADSTNTNSKIDWSATGNNIIKVKSGVGGKEPQDGGDFVYLFNNPTHEVIWKGAYCNFTQSCPVQEFAVHYIANGGQGSMSPSVIKTGVRTPTKASTFTRPGYVQNGWKMTRDDGKWYMSDKQWAFGDFNSASGVLENGCSLSNETTHGNVYLYANWHKRHTVAFDTQGGHAKPALIRNGKYRIVSAINENKNIALNRRNDTYSVPQEIVIYDGVSQNNSIWYLERYLDTDYYYIMNAEKTAFLTGNNGHNKQIHMSRFSSGGDRDRFLWKAVDEGDGYFSFVNKKSGYAMDLPNGNIQNSTSINEHTANHSPAQKWKPVVIDNTADYPTKVKISNREMYIPSSAPEKPGYKFLGWNTEKNGKGTMYQPGENYTPDQEGGTVTLYAQWEQIGYPVTYKPNGAPGSDQTDTVYWGSNWAVRGSIFNREGYEMVSWNTQPDGSGEKYTFGTIFNYITGPIDLYAQWKPNEYTIKYDGNGHTSGSTKESKHTYDVAANLTPNGYEKTGYTFMGWNTEPNGTGTSYKDEQSVKNLTSVNGDTITLYAQWKINMYTNNIDHWAYGFKHQEGNNKDKTAYKLNGTKFQQVYNSSFVINEDRKVQIPRGFYLDVDFGTAGISGAWQKYPMGTTVIQKPNNMNFDFEYYPTKFEIHYDLAGGTNNPDNPSEYDILYGVTLKKPTRPGYTFDGWTTPDGTPVTGINQDKDAAFSSPEEMYKELEYRQMGDVELVATWHPSQIVVNYLGSGGTREEGSKKRSKRAATEKVSEAVDWEDAKTYEVRKNKDWAKFEKDKNAFVGWKKDKDSNAGSTDYNQLYLDTQTYTIDLQKEYAEAMKENPKARAEKVYEHDLPAVWDTAPTITIPNDKDFEESRTIYEGTTFTREDLLRGITANDDEDGNLTNQIKITRIDYSAGKLVDGEEQPAYAETWKDGMPKDAILDTWFLQLKENKTVTHKITYEVTDRAGNTTTATGTVRVKYNNFPTINAEDRYFTLEEAQSGVITEEELLKGAIESEMLKAADEEEDKDGKYQIFTKKVKMLDFNAEEFKNFTDSGYRRITFHVQDTFGPNGKGKETLRQILVYVVKDGVVPEPEKAKEVRFISEKYYNRNKDCNPETMTEEEKKKANENGGLNVDSKWYKEADYREVIQNTFKKKDGDGEIYHYTLEDIERMREFIDEHGVGNTEEPHALSLFADEFMGEEHRAR
ncbi:MAG: InlB B-repeat-containing protein [Lachnospiraceae bacterium]|nr:InlB B-repeat-containing protein [Lachnospiraceae bacterium]